MADNGSDRDVCPAISVVFPLVDARGNPLHRVRTWTHQQTYPRDRYQIVAVSDGSDRRMEEQVGQLLGPNDRLVRHRTANCTELFDVGVRQAQGRLLVLTEHHCLAHPDCLAEVAAFFQQHDLDAACLHVQWAFLNEIARLKWQERNQERLSYLVAPDHWNKFILAGFAVYRDVLLAAGGIEYPYGLFVEVATGAKLHSLGYRVGHVERAIVEHIDDNRFEEVLGFIRDYTEGEIAYVAENDPDHCERYFGHIPEWAQQHEYWPRCLRTSRLLWRTLWANLKRGAERRSAKAVLGLASELLRRMPGRVLSPRLRLVLARLAVRAGRLRFAFWWFNDQQRLRALKDTCNRMVHLVRLKSIMQRFAGEARRSPTLHLSVRELTWHPDQMTAARRIGCHAKESYRGRGFRWTEPAATFLLDVPPDDYQVTIDTQGLNGPDCDSLLACFWNDHLVKREAIGVQDGRLCLPISREMFVPQALQQLTLICRPLLPRRWGIADDRRLGLPIFSIQCVRRAGGIRKLTEVEERDGSKAA